MSVYTTYNNKRQQPKLLPSHTGIIITCLLALQRYKTFLINQAMMDKNLSFLKKTMSVPTFLLCRKQEQTDSSAGANFVLTSLSHIRG